MGYQVFDQTIQGQYRLAGYGVPAYCDHPGCMTQIDRGMGYACCGGIHFDGSCGGFYCSEHEHKYVSEDELEDLDDSERAEYLKAMGLKEDPVFDEYGNAQVCIHEPIEFKEHPLWINHISKKRDWAKFRKEQPEKFNALKALVRNKNESK